MTHDAETVERELIAELIDDNLLFDDLGNFYGGIECAADAILAAMPEIVRAMVKPIKWMSIAPTFQKCGEYSITHYGGMQEPYKLLIGPVASYHVNEMDAKQAANDHHRAQVLGALGL